MYKNYLESEYNDTLISINFRNKNKKGWSDPYVSYCFKKSVEKNIIYNDDEFIMGWNNGLYSRPICHDCPFSRIPRVSDITIADFWGVEEISPHLKNKKGTSIGLFNTANGERIYNILNKFMFMEEVNLDAVIMNNPRLKSSVKASTKRDLFMKDMINGENFKNLSKKHMKKRPLFKRIASVVLNKDLKIKIKRMVK